MRAGLSPSVEGNRILGITSQHYVFEFHPEHGFCLSSDPAGRTAAKASDSAIERMMAKIHAAFKPGDRVVHRKGLDPPATFDRARGRLVEKGDIAHTKDGYIMQYSEMFAEELA